MALKREKVLLPTNLRNGLVEGPILRDPLQNKSQPIMDWPSKPLVYVDIVKNGEYPPFACSLKRATKSTSYRWNTKIITRRERRTNDFINPEQIDARKPFLFL